jgi:serine protease inhibitor
VKLLFCSCAFSCFAGSSDITELNLEQQQTYISNSINTFFQIKSSNQADTANYLFSPFGLESCIATFGQILFPATKQKLNDKLTSLGINPNMSLSLEDESKLQLLTAILTREEVTQVGRDRLNLLNVFLGEYLLQNIDETHDDYDTLENRRQAFKEKITNILSQKFNGNLNLDYKELWSAETNPTIYLHIISAVKFRDDWRGKPFKNIGLDTFYTKDNKQIHTDFMEKTILGRPTTDKNSNWQAIRLLYKGQYVLDIMLPTESDQSTNAEKEQIIYALFAKLNKSKLKYEQDTHIIMPKFEYKQQTSLASYIKSNILRGIKPDYRGFLVDADHQNIIDASQNCYIKIDEKGTTAEIKTNMTCADGGSRPYVDFLVNRSYFFILSEYVKGSHCCDPFKIKNIIMIGEVGNPSEQLVVPK